MFFSLNLLYSKLNLIEEGIDTNLQCSSYQGFTQDIENTRSVF